MAQNDRHSEYLKFKPEFFCMDSEFSDSDSYSYSNCDSDSYSDSDSDSYSGWLWFNLWLGFVLAQNDQDSVYINFEKAYFCPDRDSSDSDSYSDSDVDGYSYIGWLRFNLWIRFLMA